MQKSTIENKKMNEAHQPLLQQHDVGGSAFIRNPKFRAWNGAYNYMAYQGEPDLETIQSFMHHYADQHLMEATGVFDKKGKEMYELDIVTYTVSCGNGDASVYQDEKGRYVFHAIVLFEKGAFIAKQIRRDGQLTFGFPLSVLEKELIVGNFYQRPEVCWLS